MLCLEDLPYPIGIMNQYLQLVYNLGSLHHGEGNTYIRVHRFWKSYKISKMISLCFGRKIVFLKNFISIIHMNL